MGFFVVLVGALRLVAMGEAPVEGNGCECGEGIEVRRGCRMNLRLERFSVRGLRIEWCVEGRYGEPVCDSSRRDSAHQVLGTDGLTSYRLAKELGVALPRVYDIVKGTLAISADMALRLGAFFGLPAHFWMNLQNEYDLRTAEVEGLTEIRPYSVA